MLAPKKLLTLLAPVLAPVLAVAIAAPAAAAPPDPPYNRWAGPDGTSSMHGDSGASDTTPYAGPGADAGRPEPVVVDGVCPTIVAGSDGLPQALCTNYLDRAPTLHLLDPGTGRPRAKLALKKGSLLGGVYAYVDERNRMVTVDGTGDVLFIAHDQGGSNGRWRLFVDDRIDLGRAFTRACGTDDCDAVTTVAPGFDGRVWFATAEGRVGYAGRRTRKVRLRLLGAGEIVANSISTAPSGTSVVTDHATYQVRAKRAGGIKVVWRRGYDRGSARKPGQLSHGSGASPTFFGPRTGHEYVAVTDNARPRERLLVYRARTGKRVCRVPIFDADNSGTENSPVAWGRSVYVASTFGYPYPTVPEGAGDAVPARATFAGGMQRIDVTKRGCRTVWRTRVPSSAVPKLSRAENVVYTVTRRGVLPRYQVARISPRTGEVLSETPLSSGPLADTLQMVGTILKDGTLMQGSLSGLTVVPPQ